MTDWVAHAVWWHVYPLGFVGAPSENAVGADGRLGGEGAPLTHRLARIEGWLDYAVELGASGLALGPIFAARTHGYDTTDYFRIDPRLGDEGDFDSLVAAAHDRRLRVLLDGVFNHVGVDFEPLRRAISAGRDAADATWFKGTARRPGSAEGLATFEGHGDLIELDHTRPEVASLVTDVMIHWMDRGADGWRLDAAYAVPPAFWTAVLPAVRAAHPDAYIVGEVIHGDYAAIVEASGMDAVTQYELWKAVWSSLDEGNFFELAWALDRHNGFLETFVPLTFLGNHDVTRLASRLHDIARLPHAVVLLCTLAGTPSVYAGDEQAFRGVKEDRAGGDDEVRPAFPDGPGQLAPYGWDMYRLHQQLIGLRRRHPWLHCARSAVIHLDNLQLVYELRAHAERLVVALSIDDRASTVPVPGAAAVEAGSVTLVRPGTPEATAELPPKGWAVLWGPLPEG